METGSWESWGGASKRAWMVMRVLEPAGWSFTVEVEEVLLEEAETLENGGDGCEVDWRECGLADDGGVFIAYKEVL